MRNKQELDRHQQGTRGVYISIFTYIILAAGKIGFGLATGSQGLVADGWNNASDVISSLAILFGMIIARKPADHDHKYGHFRAETAAALVAGIIMAVVGIDVLKNTGTKLFQGEAATMPTVESMYVAITGAVIMYIVYLINKRIAKKTNNLAVMAMAYDNRSDALVSVSALVGIVVTRIGLGWADAIVASIVGIIILYTAWQVVSQAIHALMDGFEEEKLKEIEQRIKQVEGIREIIDLRARYQGSAVLVDVTIGVDHHLNVVESHGLTETVEGKLIGFAEIKRVYVHVEPFMAKGKTC
ncbi:cation transporter [Brevibacillus fluminis]|uniref:Cation transporter n=1 Tax=Brevibacillus fluminis TaxID=511487 RepID=A0A3M8DVT0_9BACL|nr:cation diffusion facilitator family transporter [Brevibacillus fluminis]RNB92278.1 cation transporter [Brevibacillus fluminis]